MYSRERILLVDDDVDFLNTTSTILREEGYRVETAQTGAEALEKCRKEFYSLLLIDIKLPDIEGIQLLSKIEETDPKLRKIVITGFPSLENAKEALNMGAHGYLIKPFEAETLLKTIERQLEERDKEFKDRYPILG